MKEIRSHRRKVVLPTAVVTPILGSPSHITSRRRPILNLEGSSLRCKVKKIFRCLKEGRETQGNDDMPSRLSPQIVREGIELKISGKG